jgi:hypothetical protein
MTAVTPTAHPQVTSNGNARLLPWSSLLTSSEVMCFHFAFFQIEVFGNHVTEFEMDDGLPA